VPDPRSTAVRFGAFDVLGRVGFGGMGEVFRARISKERRHAEVGQSDAFHGDIALKLLRPEYAVDPHFREMFMAEARVGAFLHHRNIVSLYDVGEVEGMLYLATELVDGVSLDRILDAGALPTPVAVHVACELLDALHYAHELTADTGRPLNIVHRDVSASNTLVSRRGEVKLTDFGLAKIEGLSLTLTDEVKGKRAYMAPEQLDGGPMDRRADIFAMGVLLHELVTRSRPFTDVADWVKSARKIEGTPFDKLISKALAPQPDDRFASAAELGEALRRACAPAPDAEQELSQRVRASQEALRPLNKLDRIFLDELAGAGQRPSSGASIRNRLDDLPTEPLPIKNVVAPSSPRRRRSLVVAGVLATAALMFGTLWLARRDHRAAPTAMTPPPPPTTAPLSTHVEIPSPAPSPPSSPLPRPLAETTAEPPEKPHLVRAKPNPRPHAAPKRAAPTVRGAPEPEVVAGSPGYLLLDTDPWATVYLGSSRLGTTPLRVPLPPGRHQLSLQPKDPTQRRTITVVITSGKEERMSLSLR
jgi:serine/threonine protein kinase